MVCILPLDTTSEFKYENHGFGRGSSLNLAHAEIMDGGTCFCYLEPVLASRTLSSSRVEKPRAFLDVEKEFLMRCPYPSLVMFPV